MQRCSITCYFDLHENLKNDVGDFIVTSVITSAFRLHIQVSSGHCGAESGHESGRHECARLGEAISHDTAKSSANAGAEKSVRGIYRDAICGESYTGS